VLRILGFPVTLGLLSELAESGDALLRRCGSEMCEIQQAGNAQSVVMRCLIAGLALAGAGLCAIGGGEGRRKVIAFDTSCALGAIGALCGGRLDGLEIMTADRVSFGTGRDWGVGSVP
jgi:hypothetical protein